MLGWLATTCQDRLAAKFRRLPSRPGRTKSRACGSNGERRAGTAGLRWTLTGVEEPRAFLTGRQGCLRREGRSSDTEHRHIMILWASEELNVSGAQECSFGRARHSGGWPTSAEGVIIHSWSV